MDGPWRTESYNPSSACEVAPYQRLEPEQFKAEVEALQIATQQIAKTPYDPEIWLNRGQSLRMLGYPELALGDTYKARLLVEAALSPIITPLGTSTLQTFSKKTYDLHMNHPAYAKWKSAVATPELLEAWVLQMLKRLELQIWTELMEGLMAANCCADYLRLSKEAVERFPDDQMFPSEVANAESWYEQREAILKEKVEEGEMTKEQMQSTLMNGGVYPTAYPWITKDLLSRSETLLQTMKQEFKTASTNCTVARSTIRNITQENQPLSEEALSEIDVLGVIAERPILAGETILIDPTLSAVLSSTINCPTCCGALPESPSTNPCCEITYCSPKCSTLAIRTYHPALCSKDLSYLTTPATSATQTTDFSLDSLLLLRVLALSIQESPTKTQNPLNSSLLQRLTPTYDMATPQLIIFNFDSHIRTPLLILKTLNIDIFSNENYDTWILHTIRCRLQNNKHGQTINNSVGTAVNPLYSMFNHSCRPNVDWRHDGGDSTLTMFVERDVGVGEELFISYIRGKEVESGRVIGWRERGSMLMGWFGMECRCVRCLEEMEAEAEGEVDGDVEVKVERLAEKLDSVL